MDPDIFYFGYDSDPAFEREFAAIGRLLALAQRFESACAILAYIVYRKRNAELILSDHHAMAAAVKKFFRQPMRKNLVPVSNLFEEEISTKLDDARKARNELAHELTRGFEHWPDEPARLAELMEHLRQLAYTFGHADYWLSLMTSAVTHEPIPTITPHAYATGLQRWVVRSE